MSVLAILTSTNCAVCSRPLTDAESIAAGVGPDCRALHGYDLTALDPAIRAEANTIIHALAAAELLDAEDIKKKLFRLAEMSFRSLATRIERRLWRRIRQQTIQFEAPEPEAPPVPVALPFTLTAGQDQARQMVSRLKQAYGYGLGVIAGFAGTGKSTMLRVLAADHGIPVVITPTGRAALRVKEAAGLQASTIHRWLYKPEDDPRTGLVKFVRRLPEDVHVPSSRLVLLDEASMVGPDIWKDVQQICKQLDLKLVLVGDGFQLPPVQGPNEKPFSVLLPEFAAAHGAERIEMTEVLRQAEGNPVIRASMALRSGEGIRALRDLPQIEISQLRDVVAAVHRGAGVTICHRNQTRMQLNKSIRETFGIFDELPQVSEPLMVLKNSYEAGVVNGETILFEGWVPAAGEPLVPSIPERVYDRWKQTEEFARFGATTLGGGRIKVSICAEELHGKLTVGARPIAQAAEKWARIEGLVSGDALAPHLHVNFGYAYTAHKAQGSEWPWVLVVLEPSVRFNEEEGRRWAYTAVTRSTQMTAIHVMGR